MKKILLLLCAVILFCSMSKPWIPWQRAHAAERGENPLSPEAYQKMLGRGMDTDWAKTKEGRKYYSETAVKKFRQAGISHVRIRVKDSVSDELFQKLDVQIQDCLRYGMIPVLAYQADEFKNSVSDESMAKAVEWWKTVAEHYKDYSYLLSFDLMIECSDALNKQPQRLNEYFEKAVSAVRVTNPKRILMISPRLRSDPAYLKELEIPSQANGYLMAEWHFYASGPSKENPRKLWTTGKDNEKKLIKDKINLALAWQKETGIPTWVGAWMAGNYNDGDDYSMEEQIRFANYMVTQLDAAGIPFAVNSDTKFYSRDSNDWIVSMQPLRYCIYDSFEKAVNMLLSLSKVKLSPVRAVSKNSIQADWKKLSRAHGYRLVISTDRKFGKGTRQYTISALSKKISNLQAGKTYYVKVRGYRKSGGRVIYSYYSRTMKIKL